MTSPEKSPLRINPIQDRVPRGETLEALGQRTQGNINDEKIKFHVWQKGEGGCQCRNCQRLSRIQRERVKIELDGSLYPPLPLPVNRKQITLSSDITETVRAAQQEL